MNPALKSLLRTCLPHSVKRQRILAGPLRGYSIVTSWHDYPGAITGRTERPLLEWFTQKVRIGDTWLDIGAHYGYTAIALSRLVGEHGRVFAFEPMLSTVGHLSETRRFNHLSQLTVMPFALGAVDHLALHQLPTTRGMVDSTLGSTNSWPETLLIVNLDWLWPRIRHDDPRIDGIKIDVQGMEIDVLRGMIDTLRVHRPKLVVEIHRDVDRALLLDMVETAGYCRSGIPIEPLPDETMACYYDDRSYAFERLE